MRTLAKFILDVDAATAAIANGELERIMNSSLEIMKPEAVYFLTERGQRTAYIVFDLKTPADIPAIAEPWFKGLKAAVELMPVMNADDLKSGLGKYLSSQSR